jgi:ABC-type transporter Mla subunit MlaD
MVMLRFLAAAGAIALATTGCGKIKKTSECNTFIDKVNASLKEIEKHTTKKSDDEAQTIAGMQKLGELYTALAKDVGDLEITTKDLEKHVGEYQQMAERAASTARDVATAVQAKDGDKIDKAQKEFDRIVKQEDELVNKINSFCQAP